MWFHGNPEAYAATLKAASEEIRAAGGRVATGGLCIGVTLKTGFLEALYQAGCGDFFDAVCVHAYFDDGEPTHLLPQQLTRIRDQMARHGDAAKPIWITETGSSASFRMTEEDMALYPFSEDKAMRRISGNGDEALQAAGMAKILCTAFNAGVEVVMPYELKDAGFNGRSAFMDQESQFGLCRDNYVPKPAYSAYAFFTWIRPEGSVQKAKIAIGRFESGGHGGIQCSQWLRPEDREIDRRGEESARPGRDAGAVWATLPMGHRRIRFTSGDMRFYDHLGRELMVKSVGTNTFDLVIGTAPTYFIGGEVVVEK